MDKNMEKIRPIGECPTKKCFVHVALSRQTYNSLGSFANDQ